jgi:glycosyltransferase involved in cell wall biosynthesis
LKPILSICIPTYNRARWIYTTLANFCNLDNDLKSLIEIVISDNHSIDNTKQISHEFIGLLNLKYIYRDKNYGYYDNFYKCIIESEGRFCFLLGDDDLVSIKYLSKLLLYLEGCSSDVTVISMNMGFWNESVDLESNEIIVSTSELESRLGYSEINFIEAKTFMATNISHGYFNAISSFILKREAAIAAFEYSANFKTMFSSTEDTFPFSCYIIDHLLYTKCVFVEAPVILGYTNVSWMNRYCITWFFYFPDLILRFYKKINNTICYENDIKYIIENKYPELIRIYFKNFTSKELIVFLKLVSRYFKYKSFRTILFSQIFTHLKLKINVWKSFCYSTML